MMPEHPETPASEEGQVDIGPPPYYHRWDCNICRKQDGLATPARMETPPTGGYILQTDHFIGEHAPLNLSTAGTVIVEARRHLLDFGEMTPVESGDLGAILHRLVPAIKTAAGAHRVYFLPLMERAPHFHLWLVPKQERTEPRGVDYLAQPPGPASPSDADAMARSIRAEFGKS
jgi:diadenosine tetraphosphate (Ap4A) HIT family hydrolase